jgi:DNA-binding XRE family transcriptional regulator
MNFGLTITSDQFGECVNTCRSTSGEMAKKPLSALKKLRVSQNLTQQELADLLDVTMLTSCT